MSYQPKTFTASATLTASDAGTMLLVSAAAGLTLTLPAASGTGRAFKIVVATTVTSNSVVVKVANATDVMAGLAVSAADGGDSVNGWETASTSDTITLNATTTGGIKGDMIELVDCASGLWSVQMRTASTSTEATPFSATVS